MLLQVHILNLHEITLRTGKHREMRAVFNDDFHFHGAFMLAI